MTKLFKKLTRDLTNQEAAHIGSSIWGYSLKLALDDASDADEKKEVREQFCDAVRTGIGQIFDEQADNPLQEMNDYFCVDEEVSLTFFIAMKTFEYLLKIGVLV